MTIKKILVVYSGSDTDEATMMGAVQMAQEFGAHITAICATSSVNVPGVLDILPEENSRVLLDQLQAQERRREEEAYENFNSFVKRQGLEYLHTPAPRTEPSVSWESLDGQLSHVVARRGGAFDLIVIGQPEEASDGTTLVQLETIESALFSTGRPVLIMPPDTLKTLGETVLIGWNRSAQSARAFHAAKALLLQRAKKVRILSVTTGAKNGPPATEVADNLAWHGIDCDVIELSPDNRSVGAVLLAEADALGADLVVMGAYTHSRLRQLLLGGVTKHLLSNTRIPLFMAH